MAIGLFLVFVLVLVCGVWCVVCGVWCGVLVLALVVRWFGGLVAW